MVFSLIGIIASNVSLLSRKIIFFTHQTRYLRLVQIGSILLQSVFYLMGLMAFMYHFLESKTDPLYFVASLLVGIVILFFQNFTKVGLSFCLFWFLIIFPYCLTSEDGLICIMFTTMGFIIGFLEKRNKVKIVEVVSKFSEAYSPLYTERLAKKSEFKRYLAAYNLLSVLDLSDFTLIREEVVTTRNFKTNLEDRQLNRTFKISGLLGTVRVTDDLSITPQKLKLIKLR